MTIQSIVKHPTSLPGKVLLIELLMRMNEFDHALYAHSKIKNKLEEEKHHFFFHDISIRKKFSQRMKDQTKPVCNLAAI